MIRPSSLGGHDLTPIRLVGGQGRGVEEGRLKVPFKASETALTTRGTVWDKEYMITRWNCCLLWFGPEGAQEGGSYPNFGKACFFIASSAL